MDRLTDFSLKITQLNRNWSTDTGVNKNICGWFLYYQLVAAHRIFTIVEMCDVWHFTRRNTQMNADGR